MGESKPKSTDTIRSAKEPIEGVGTSDPGLGPPDDGIPVVLVVVLVIVSAIGSGFGLLLARKAKRERRPARQRGAESSA
jgi:hypothetical protein